MAISFWNEDAEKPAQPLCVVDMSVMVPGPFLTRIFVQYGAQVIKIEALPEGDPLRSVKTSHLFELLNQGKQGIAVNLKTSEGQALVQELVSEADIFVENFREGVMDRIGLGYPILSEKNPDLIYLSLRGLSGNKSGKSAHDLNFIAQSGCGEWFLESGPNYSTQFADLVGGTFVPTIQLLFQLLNPSHRGMHLISTMDENFRSLFLPRAFDAVRAESMPADQRDTFGIHLAFDGTYPHSRYYRCRDNQWLSLNAIQEKHWGQFCETINHPEWKPRMWDKTLCSDVEKLFFNSSSSHWENLFSNREACVFRVTRVKECLEEKGERLLSDPLSWAGFSPNSQLSASPALGQHTGAVLRAMGVQDTELQALQTSGIVK